MYKDDTKLFFSPLPEIIFNPQAPPTYSIAESLCSCTGPSCHESENSLIHKYPQIARDILSPLVKRHARRMAERPGGLNTTALWRSSLSPPDSSTPVSGHTPGHAALPLIPQVAIHYRCGDNDVGVYGLLAYSSVLRRIPEYATSIYVMTEDEHRKTRPEQRAVCRAVLHSLHKRLSLRFPLAAVLVLRGADIYDDFTRLASAAISICSVSTFCFWAAIGAEGGTVYMPQSKLIAAGTTPNYGSNIVWMNRTTDYVVPGPVIARFGRMPRRVVDMLGGP